MTISDSSTRCLSVLFANVSYDIEQCLEYQLFNKYILTELKHEYNPRFP